MNVFYTANIAKSEWRDACARPEGQPLQCWFAEAEQAYNTAGCPAGSIRIRHRVVTDSVDAGVHDGMRSGVNSYVGMVMEIGTI